MNLGKMNKWIKEKCKEKKKNSCTYYFPKLYHSLIPNVRNSLSLYICFFNLYYTVVIQHVSYYAMGTPVFLFIYFCVRVHAYIYIYIYIYMREREREREKEREN